ncbi:MAG: hypothetical protein PVF83_07850 [Anaerolineales bacterium]|jgi:hypothetical protein
MSITPNKNGGNELLLRLEKLEEENIFLLKEVSNLRECLERQKFSSENREVFIKERNIITNKRIDYVENYVANIQKENNNKTKTTLEIGNWIIRLLGVFCTVIIIIISIVQLSK